jgi:hypothetical protein
MTKQRNASDRAGKNDLRPVFREPGLVQETEVIESLDSVVLSAFISGDLIRHA